MATNVIMPQGGQDLTEGTVLSWSKNEGDTVTKGELLCEVETEKATFEVSAPCDGVLLKIITPAGEVAEVFSAIGVVGQAGEQIDTAGASEKKIEKAPEKPNVAVETPKIDIAVIRRRLGKNLDTKPARLKASGRAKKRAREKGVDLTEVQGTGPGGRIVERDVLEYAEQTIAAPPAAFSATPVAFPQNLQGRRESMSKMRKVIARRMQQSKHTIPHFYVTVSVEMTDALALREELNSQVDADSPVKISVNDLIVKAAALALEEFPQVNCMLDGEQLVYLDNVNIGIAVGLDEGLVVPVLAEADVLSLRGIAKKTKELTSLAKSGKQAGLAQGSFTISNMGMLDVENFAAIINPPESAILAIGAIQKSVVVSEKNDLSIRDIMKMTVSVDHRIVDGVVAANFINKIKYHLQNPKTLLY